MQGIQGVAGANGKDGADGHDGANGHDGVTRIQIDTKTQKQVVNNEQKILSNSLNITANTQGVTNNAKSISATNQRVNNNTTQLSRQDDELHSLHSEIQNMNGENNAKFNALKDEVDRNEKQANAGISGAMAMAAIPQVQTNQHVMFGAGAGEYNGESALAVGASVNFNDHVVGKVNMSADTANNYGVSVGVGVGF
ncbi:YadA C-terminal domain-containing protein [Kluyvera sp. 142486]|uniref:YadA C-terminal domain-containing protein n=1 Tax=Kluyvera sp. 142486 TaxID=3390050 RepID=UPI00397F02B9